LTTSSALGATTASDPNNRAENTSSKPLCDAIIQNGSLWLQTDSRAKSKTKIFLNALGLRFQGEAAIR